MRDLIQETPLCQLPLPGSHDAGSYGAIRLGSRAQALSVKEQLYAGVRYFDFRVIVDGDVFFSHHGSDHSRDNIYTRKDLEKPLPPVFGKATNTLFHDINEFCIQHDGEIVILSFGDFYRHVSTGLVSGNFISTDTEDFIECIERDFGKLLIPVDKYDLRLMSSVSDVKSLPKEGKNLIIVALVEDVLHFRIFDETGEKAVDTDEKIWTEQLTQINDLKKQLEKLWPLKEPTLSQKGKVITAVQSIIGREPVKKAEGIEIPTYGECIRKKQRVLVLFKKECEDNAIWSWGDCLKDHFSGYSYAWNTWPDQIERTIKDQAKFLTRPQADVTGPRRDVDGKLYQFCVNQGVLGYNNSTTPDDNSQNFAGASRLNLLFARNYREWWTNKLLRPNVAIMDFSGKFVDFAALCEELLRT